MGNFQPGHFVPVQWQRAGGVLATLNVKQHDLTLSVLLHDVTGVKANGIRARLAGPIDAEGRVNCDMDLDEPPYLDPPLLQMGVSGVGAFGVGVGPIPLSGFTPLAPGFRFIQVPLIIEQLHFSSATDQEVKWDTSMKMNSRAGFLVFPSL